MRILDDMVQYVPYLAIIASMMYRGTSSDYISLYHGFIRHGACIEATCNFTQPSQTKLQHGSFIRGGKSSVKLHITSAVINAGGI